ncbi:MAG: L,D-transpeptidase [Gemmatimonadota bacterium]|nr:L,D-transpeptidase [Gemmatimonadota bacterium]
MQLPGRRALTILLPIAGLLGTVTAARFSADSMSSATVAAPSLRLTADLSARKLYVEEHDEIVLSFPIAVGLPQHPTPTGGFLIRKIVWNPSWVPPDEKWARRDRPRAPGDPYNPMRLVKIYFRPPDYYIHGTPYVGSLGKAASHGCLRMDPVDAAEVAQYVMEHGGQPRDENWFWRVIHARSQTKTVILRNPIPMTIVP